jgi:hypothetical protein
VDAAVDSQSRRDQHRNSKYGKAPCGEVRCRASRERADHHEACGEYKHAIDEVRAAAENVALGEPDGKKTSGPNCEQEHRRRCDFHSTAPS